MPVQMLLELRLLHYRLGTGMDLVSMLMSLRNNQAPRQHSVRCWANPTTLRIQLVAPRVV